MPNSKDFNHFDVNPTDIHIDRSMFNLDHSVKFSCNVGEVIPFDVIEVLPGDTFNINTSKVVRLQPLVAPIMDEVILDVYYFFVPNRLVWNHWKEFCGENNTSPWAPSTTYRVPRIQPPSTGWDVGTIADYMGVPPKVKGTVISALPFRAYALICDQWFRSEALMNPVNVPVGDAVQSGSNGSDQTTDIANGGRPFIACKYFDYFTAALPSPQRGEASNVFPRNSYVPVVSLDSSYETELGIIHPFKIGNSATNLGDNKKYNNPKTVTNVNNVFGNYSSNRNSSIGLDGLRFTNSDAASINSSLPVFSNLWSEISAGDFTINSLRNAFAVQRYLEKSARYGGRYIEFIKGFFGVDSPDARLQRSEYLGGSRLSLNINSVEQTSATTDTSTPLGNVAGMSVTGDISSDVHFSSTEHGLLIGCAVLRYHHSYQQGINRLWLRRSFTDYYLPTFAYLGEQGVYEEEIYYKPVNIPTQDGLDTIFGYQERWSEYRYMPNRVAGEMRSVATTSLDMWHLGDYYANAPTLSPEWIREDKTMLDRCLAVTSEVSNQCICDFFIQCEAARPLPMYSIPGMIDHY